MSFPRYESYKDSGIEWLGEVPEHWVVAPLKRGFDVRLGKMLQTDASSEEDELLPYLRAANIQWSGIDDSDIKKMWFSPNERNQLALLPGDLLISEGGDVGRSALWKGELGVFYFQNSVNRVRARESNSSRYLYYWIFAVKDKGYIDVLCNKSTIAHFTAEKVQAVPVPFPSAQEQSTIAAFLDRETAKIDALIAEQQRLIELLKEKRQAVISHAVTKGLNPDAPMKDSGIEWLGDVPEHWEVLMIKRFSTLQRGYDLTDAERAEGPYPVVTSSGISGTHDSFMAHGPGVVTGRYGSTGRLFYVEDNFWPHNTSLYVRDFHGNFHRFVWYSLQAVDFTAHSAKAAVPGIDRNDIHVLPVVVPPKGEQPTIVAFLDRETSKLDLLVAEAQTAITLLQERRTALISAAVTGKIDVRGLVATQPEREAAA